MNTTEPNCQSFEPILRWLREGLGLAQAALRHSFKFYLVKIEMFPDCFQPFQ